MGISRFPLNESTIRFYVRQRAAVDRNKVHNKIGVNAKTISAELGAISKWAVLSGFPKVDPSWKDLKDTIKGYRKELPQLKIEKRDPITELDLIAVIRTMSGSKDDEMFIAAWTTAFRGLMRVGEFTVLSFDPDVLEGPKTLRINNIRFRPSWKNDQFLQIRLKVSKTDIFREGVTLNIARTDGALCAVSRMKKMLESRGVVDVTSKRSHGSEFLFRLNERPISRAICIEKFKKHAMLAGRASKNFNGISFRKRGYQTLLDRHVPLPLIMLM